MGTAGLTALNFPRPQPSACWPFLGCRALGPQYVFGRTLHRGRIEIKGLKVWALSSGWFSTPSATRIVQLSYHNQATGRSKGNGQGWMGGVKNTSPPPSSTRGSPDHPLTGPPRASLAPGWRTRRDWYAQLRADGCQLQGRGLDQTHTKPKPDPLDILR